MPRIVVTAGEPAGIGPEIVAQLAHHPLAGELVVVADPDLVAERAVKAGINLDIRMFDPGGGPMPHVPGSLVIVPCRLRAPANAGKLDPANSEYVLDTLARAVDMCVNGECQAMVTAPVHKGIINDAGIAFTGHTEWIAERTGADHPVMMLARDGFRVCLATIHIPLAEVPASISRTGLAATLRVIDQGLSRLYGIQQPHIAVCGLNPHAGEGGHLGREEIDVIAPVIQSLTAEGMNLAGPLPADTAFTREKLADFDAVLAMYHDQGLPVIKHAGFGKVVNVTLGLPIIRTSVDHGTALDLAGTGTASESSLVAAAKLALEYAGSRPSN